jgi:hypothetical protein
MDRKHLEYLWRRAKKCRVMKKGLCRCMPPFNGLVKLEMVRDGIIIKDAHGSFLFTHEGIPVPVAKRPLHQNPDTIRWLIRLYRTSKGLSRRDFQILVNTTGARITPLEIRRLEKRRQETWDNSSKKMAQALGMFHLAA